MKTASKAVMRLRQLFLSAVACLGLLASASAFAVTIPVTSGDELLGFDGLEFDGQIWNVVFTESPTAPATSGVDGNAAQTALANALESFLNGDSARTISGCNSGRAGCFLFTPTDAPGASYVAVAIQLIESAGTITANLNNVFSSPFPANLGDNNIGVTWTQVTPVPLPAAGWLFLTGLLGVAGVARRRRYTD